MTTIKYAFKLVLNGKQVSSEQTRSHTRLTHNNHSTATTQAAVITLCFVSKQNQAHDEFVCVCVF